MKANTDKATTPFSLLRYEGEYPPKEPGYLPCCKLDWDGRMVQMFTDNLEQGCHDFNEMIKAVNEHAALNAIALQLASIMDELSDGNGISQHSGQKSLQLLKTLATLRAKS